MWNNKIKKNYPLKKNNWKLIKKMVEWKLTLINHVTDIIASWKKILKWNMKKNYKKNNK